MIRWIAINSYELTPRNRLFFDPFPSIRLNPVLSMMAAILALVLMMPQNRHAAKDRADATHDYEVNLMAWLEVLALHQKIDALQEHQ